MSTQATNSQDNPLVGFGPNEWIVEDMYQRYLADPASVDPAWHDFFADYKPAGDPGARRARSAGEAPPATAGRPGEPGARRPHGHRAVAASAGRRSAPGARQAGAPAPARPAGDGEHRAEPRQAPATAGRPQGHPAARRGRPHRPEHGRLAGRCRPRPACAPCRPSCSPTTAS